MTLAEVLELIGRVQVTWPRVKWDAPVRFVGEVWLPYLADLPADAVRATLLDLPPTWAPAPGELRNAVLDRIDPDPTPDGDQAWAEVRAGIGRWGAYSRAEDRAWSHPAIADAVEAMGWRELCRSDNPGADRAQFRGFYATAAERHRPRRTPPAAAAAIDAARSTARALPSPPGEVALPRVEDHAAEANVVRLNDLKRTLVRKMGD